MALNEILNSDFLNTVILTLKLAGLTTIILLVFGLPIAYWLSITSSRTKPIIETLVAMPLVLPPSVLGFYMLLLFNPESHFGKFIEYFFNTRLAFSFEGLVVASIIFSLPFMIHPIQNGFKALPKSLREVSFTLGKSTFQTILFILIPNIKSAIIIASVITFAHVVGEFGVALMIGGNIPNETRVASLALYDEVDALNYDLAHLYASFLFLLSFIVLFIIFKFNNKDGNQ